MEMTIEEAHGILSNGLVNAPSEHEWCVAFKMAIDTMHKYQKIQQIIEDWEHDKGWALEMTELYWLDRVKEVIEDGNDD